MHTPSHTGSKSVVAASRRFRMEYRAEVDTLDLIQARMDEFDVIDPNPDTEGDPPNLTAVLNGNVKARIRRNGKFYSVSKAQDLFNMLQDRLNHHREIRRECQSKIARLLGGKSGKWLVKQRAMALGGELEEAA